MKRKPDEMKAGELTLIEGLTDARDHERGKRKLNTREVATVELRPLRGKEIRAIREGMNLTQLEFARRLNVSMGSVAQWEVELKGKHPTGAALKLLHIAKRHPEVFEG